MKVWKNKDMPEWSPETGTHYQQRITLGETEKKQRKKTQKTKCGFMCTLGMKKASVKKLPMQLDVMKTRLYCLSIAEL